MSVSPEYDAWRAMKSRCHDVTHQGYARYGLRGIAVCDRWRNSFKAFLNDMGPRPLGMTLERINNDGNYEPGNVRWATQKEQCRNRSNSVNLTFNGATKTVAEWAEELGLKHNVIRSRMRKGWTAAECLSPAWSVSKRASGKSA